MNRHCKSFKLALYCSASLLLTLLSGACTLTQVTPTPTPTPITPTATPTETPTPSPSPTDTVTPTITPTPSPTLFVSLVPRVLAGETGMIYVRQRPGTLLPVDRTVNTVAPWDAIGRTSDNQWLQVEFDDGYSGWIVYLPDEHAVDINSLPVTADSLMTDRVALVTAETTQFYTDAGDNIQADLARLSSLRIDARSSDGAWLHGVDTEGRTGWVANEGMLLTFAADSLETRDVTISVTAAVEPNGRVRLDSGGLRLRQFPSAEATILLNLIAGTAVAVSERTSDNGWVLVQLREGYRGWVSAQYVELDSGFDLTMFRVNEDPQPVPYFVPPTPVGAPQVLTVGGGARNIFVTGQARGNRPNIFTTVGDSLTDTPYFLRTIPNGFDLGQYGYLLPVIQFFNADTGLGNAFARRAISTRAGWSTFSVVVEQHPELGGTCNAGELALECEYRLTRPAYALVMIGTNDAPAFGADQYRANMTRIIEISIANGVVPILSTLPPRNEFNDRIIEYNAVILQLSQAYGVPMTDLYSALVNLPNRGLDGDGIHLSIPPGAPASTMIFNSTNLQYGTTMRNLTALQALEQVRSLAGY